MPAPPLYDLSAFDFANPLFGSEAIRAVNPQRFEMEQLTAVVHVDERGRGIVGYKDVAPDEWWCRGHMSGFPLMPGVLQCEAAAQLAGFFAKKYGLLGGSFVGFGGLDDVRFRAPVYPGSRLDLAARAVSVRAGRRAEFEFQGFVGGTMVLTGHMIGVGIDADVPAG